MKEVCLSMKALLIGSSFVEELNDYFDYFETKIMIVNESPLSDDFSVILENVREDVDFVIVDLMICASWLFKQSKKFKTLHIEDNAEQVYDPVFFRCTQFDKNYNFFINKLLERFTSDKIFIISASLPPYFVTRSQLRNINKAGYISEWKQSYKFIKKLENKFIKKTNATVINLSRFYFIKKQIGYDVSFVRYEDFLYKDINQWFYDFQNGILRECPMFEFKLDRYILYQCQTIHYKGFYRFLNEEDAIDEFILSSPRQYVIENYSNFMRLHAFEEQLCNEKLYNLVQNDKVLTNDFKQVVMGFLLLRENASGEIEHSILKKCFKIVLCPIK